MHRSVCIALLFAVIFMSCGTVQARETEVRESNYSSRDFREITFIDTTDENETVIDHSSYYIYADNSASVEYRVTHLGGEGNLTFYVIVGHTDKSSGDRVSPGTAFPNDSVKKKLEINTPKLERMTIRVETADRANLSYEIKIAFNEEPSIFHSPVVQTYIVSLLLITLAILLVGMRQYQKAQKSETEKLKNKFTTIVGDDVDLTDGLSNDGDAPGTGSRDPADTDSSDRQQQSRTESVAVDSAHSGNVLAKSRVSMFRNIQAGVEINPVEVKKSLCPFCNRAMGTEMNSYQVNTVSFIGEEKKTRFLRNTPHSILDLVVFFCENCGKIVGITR